MPSPVPNPVAAALGLVPTVLGGVRRLPGKAVQLPVYAVSHALTSVTTARREYDALAERGQRLLARLRGTSFDEIEDVVEDSLQGTPFARPYDRVEDTLEDVGAGVTALVRKGTGRARTAAGSTARSAGSGLDKAADAVEEVSGADTAQKPAGKATKSVAKATQKASAKVEDAASKADKPAKAPSKAAKTASKAAGKTGDKAQQVADTVAEQADKAADKVAEVADKGADKAQQAADTVAQTAAQAAPDDAESPKGEPTPKATQPDSTRVDTAASDEVVQAVEEVSATVGGEVLPHDELPLPDYDHLTLGSLRGRMRSLDLPQLIQIRDYEKAHADRLPIVTMLDNRIAKLANDPTAPLSGGSPLAQDAAKPTPSRGGSKVTPATGGPAQNPPSQGVPTNPAQPRTTGSPGTNPNSES